MIRIKESLKEINIKQSKENKSGALVLFWHCLSLTLPFFCLGDVKTLLKGKSEQVQQEGCHFFFFLRALRLRRRKKVKTLGK